MATPVIVVFGLGAPTKGSPSILGRGVGGHAVCVASERGFTVRAVARSPAKYEALFKDLPGVSVVKGDVTNVASVAECLQGATAAIFSVQAADDVSAFEIDRDALILVAKECLKANCKLVVISSVFVSPKHYLNPLRGFLNTIVKWRMMDAKWQGEEAVRGMKGLKFTIIRPGGLTDKEALKNEYKIGQGDGLMFARFTIPKVDVGRVAVAACVDPASDNTTFELAGSSSTKPATVEGIFAGLKQDK
jgi:nucleoside-diphosphate-sugar epimerase